jgi:hypothetical protein
VQAEREAMKKSSSEKNCLGGPPDILDPGIAPLVLLLKTNGYYTTDSGDGVSKPAKDPTLKEYEDYLPYPHVFVRIYANKDPIGATKELYGLLSNVKLNKPIEVGDIQLTYDPVNEISMIIICNLTYEPGR